MYVLLSNTLDRSQLPPFIIIQVGEGNKFRIIKLKEEENERDLILVLLC